MGRGRNKSGQKWRAKVARVAKRVTLQNQETKRIGINAVNSVTQSAGATGGGSLGLVNVLDQIVLGTGRQNRVGDHITLKGINFKFNWDSVGQANLSNTVHIRVSLFKIDPFLTISGLVRDQLFLDGATAARPLANMFVRGPNEDGSIIQKTYFDKVFTFNPSLSIAVSAKHFSINVPLHNMKYKFASGTINSGDQFDLVLVTQAWVAGSTINDDTGTIVTDYRVYYKDG